MRIDNKHASSYTWFDYTTTDLQILYTIMKTHVYNNTLVDKYSEYPVNFIIKLYCNGVYLETLIADEQKLNFEKLNKRMWLWTFLNDKSRVLKFSVEEMYYDGC